MNSRQRFHETMAFGAPDRVPLFKEGIRSEVLHAWGREARQSPADLLKGFQFDPREEVELDLDPHPYPGRWPSTLDELDAFMARMDPDDRSRLPSRWKKRVRAWRDRDHVLMLRVHEGFFLTMGVEGWDRFLELMYLCTDDPGFVREMMARQGAFAARLLARWLDEVEIDAAVFSEPIAGNSGPLISPNMYAEFVLPSHQPLLDVLARYEVKTLILRTYANPRPLLPLALARGLNCLWAVEAPPEAMGYYELRRELGPGLRLIGGIDLDALRAGPAAISRALEDAAQLLQQGGYVPLADGRVRSEVSFERYSFYRRQLEELVSRPA